MSGRLEIAPFADEHLADASVLLAARHARQRLVEPLLSDAFENPDAARTELEVAWRSEGASGAAALEGGRLVGYLVGAPRRGSTWGPNIWVEPAGHAAEEAETVRDLYAHAAAAWVAAGATSHYAVVPAHDPALLDAWSRLEFGQQQGLGIREVPRPPGEPGRARVRVATADDVDEILRLDILGEYQTSSPTFASMSHPTRRRRGRSSSRSWPIRAWPASSQSSTVARSASRPLRRPSTRACTRVSRGRTTPASSATRRRCPRCVAPARASR